MSAAFDEAVERARDALISHLDRVPRRFFCDYCGAPATHVGCKFAHENGRPIVTRYGWWRCDEHAE